MSIFSPGVPIDDKLDNQCVSVEPEKKEQDNKSVVPSDKPSPWKKYTVSSEIKKEALSPNSKGEAKCESEKSEEGKDTVDPPCPPAPASLDKNDGDKAPVQPCDADLLEKRTAQETPGCNPGVAHQLPAEDAITPCGVPGPTPVLSSLLANEKPDTADMRPLASPAPTLPASPSGHVSSLPPPLMTPPGHVLDNTMNSNVAVVPRLNHAFPQGVQVNPGFIQGQPPVNHSFGTGKPASQPGTSGVSGAQQLMTPQTLAQQSRERPLLLEEQPLLLQDLLDQERQEQQQQRQMQAMIRQRSEPFFPNIGRSSSEFQK